MAFIVAARMSLAVVVVAVFTGAARFGEPGPNRGKPFDRGRKFKLNFFFSISGFAKNRWLELFRLSPLSLVPPRYRFCSRRISPASPPDAIARAIFSFHRQFAARVWVYIALYLLFILQNVFSVIFTSRNLSWILILTDNILKLKYIVFFIE